MNKTITIKEDLCRMLRIDEETYAKYVEYFGQQFARYYTQNHEWSINYLVKTASYWAWWKKLQQVRDELFILEFHEYRNAKAEDVLFELWVDANDPEEVEARPTRKILDDSYQLMLIDIDKEKEGQL